jgi:hypothetical protein
VGAGNFSFVTAVGDYLDIVFDVLKYSYYKF